MAKFIAGLVCGALVCWLTVTKHGNETANRVKTEVSARAPQIKIIPAEH